MADAMLGYSADAEYGGIEDGEIVQCALIEQRFPRSYVKQLNESNSLEKDLADKAMRTPNIRQPSYKDGGVEWSVLIMRKSNFICDLSRFISKEDVPNDFIEVMNEYMDYEPTVDLVVGEEPNYVIYTTIRLQSPNDIYSRNYFTRKGGMIETINTVVGKRPKINRVMPSGSIEQDYNTKVYANAVPAGRETEYRELVAQERRRQTNANNLLINYNKLSEEEAVNYMNEILSRQYLIYNIKNDKAYYKNLVPGVIFTAKAVRKGKYVELMPYEWSKSLGQFMVYSMPIDEKYHLDQEELDRIVEIRNKTLQAIYAKRAEADKNMVSADISIEEEEEEGDPVW